MSDIAITALIVLGVIGVSLFFYRMSKDSASNAAGKFSKINAEMAESDVAMYDETTVSGNEVLNAINKYKSEELGIAVWTKAGGDNEKTFYNYGIAELNDANPSDSENIKLGEKSDASSIQAAKTKGLSTYINPTGNFEAHVVKDSNDVVVGLTFKQV